eukprot:gb/GFBE01060903.1/.p1 GENE.gb/GFBE01060903.1/~~gb/GFBE01060903.1/.p1  ORF type:complete len:111 (+),score=19.66 gb/GFBE01060903.1/:1-333(+)
MRALSFLPSSPELPKLQLFRSWKRKEFRLSWPSCKFFESLFTGPILSQVTEHFREVFKAGGYSTDPKRIPVGACALRAALRSAAQSTKLSPGDAQAARDGWWLRCCPRGM